MRDQSEGAPPRCIFCGSGGGGDNKAGMSGTGLHHTPLQDQTTQRCLCVQTRVHARHAQRGSNIGSQRETHFLHLLPQLAWTHSCCGQLPTAAPVTLGPHLGVQAQGKMATAVARADVL